MQLFFGLLLATTVSTLAWRARALTISGAWAAIATGTLIFGLGGISWAVLLLIFFISSSALSHAFTNRKAWLNEKFSKGSQRDWGQVAANGGLGAVLAVLHVLLPGEIWPWIAFAGAMAAVNADTWATELGVLSKHAPRLITTGQTVERGTSGGISAAGTLSALAGAAVVASMAAVVSTQANFGELKYVLVLLAAVTLGGVVGSLFDSLLGAAVQAIYYCPGCQKETERHPFHTCGSKTMQVRGWRWLNNEAVNFACSAVGAAAAVILYNTFVLTMSL